MTHMSEKPPVFVPKVLTFEKKEGPACDEVYVNQGLVDTLREHLELAEQGVLSEAAVIAIESDGTPTCSWSVHDNNPTTVLGAIEWSKIQITHYYGTKEL